VFTLGEATSLESEAIRGTLMNVIPSETIFVSSIIDSLNVAYAPDIALNAVTLIVQLLTRPVGTKEYASLRLSSGVAAGPAPLVSIGLSPSRVRSLEQSLRFAGVQRKENRKSSSPSWLGLFVPWLCSGGMTELGSAFD
jgi:hypothetical protein